MPVTIITIGDYIAVCGLPEKTKPIIYYHGDGNPHLIYADGDYFNRGQRSKPLPEGIWAILGSLDELPEDQLREISFLYTTEMRMEQQISNALILKKEKQ